MASSGKDLTKILNRIENINSEIGLKLKRSKGALMVVDIANILHWKWRKREETSWNDKVRDNKINKNIEKLKSFKKDQTQISKIAFIAYIYIQIWKLGSKCHLAADIREYTAPIRNISTLQ